MQYRLRTLLILLAIGPPVIAFWPAIKRNAVQRVTQITASDAAVLAATSSLIGIRVRLHFLRNAKVANEHESRPRAT
jgi:hypothetical protein